MTWQGSYPYKRGVGDDGRAGRPASFDLHFNKDAKNPRRAARSQTIHVRKDLSADRGFVSAHVDFDSIVPVQIVLKVVEGSEANRVFEANPLIPDGLRGDDRALGRLGQPVRRAPCKLQGIELMGADDRSSYRWRTSQVAAPGEDPRRAG